MKHQIENQMTDYRISDFLFVNVLVIHMKWYCTNFVINKCDATSFI